MKNWKTSAAGLAGLIAVVMVQIQAMYDADPATVANWGAVIAMIPVTGACFFAKDSNVTGGTVQQ